MREVTLFTIALAFILAISLNAQVNVAPLSTMPVHDFAEKGETLDVVHRLSEKYRVVIGMYGYDSDRHEPKIDIAIKDGTVRDALDAITKADPRFEWQQSNGAIHFVTKDKPLLLMDITPHTFEASNPQAADIVDLFQTVPEIHAWLRTQKCVMDFLIFNDGPPRVPWGRFSVSATDLPLSLILDSIAAKSRTYDWSVIEYSSQPCKMNISWGQVQPKDKHSIQ